MTVYNQHWYNANEGICYPLDDKASSLDDEGVRLPSSIITDIRLRWPRIAGEFSFVSAVTVTPGAVSVTIQVASSMDNLDQSFVPVAVITVPIQDLEEGRQYRMEAQYPGTAGYITFGSGIQNGFVGRFSSPDQGLIAPRAASFHSGLPVKSMSKLTSATTLTGVVRLLGASPIEVVSESREIDGIERDVIVIRLVDDPTAAAAGQAEDSVFKQYGGPCSGRPESDTCGAPKPIEFVNAVGPDCDGVLGLDFHGVSVVGINTDDCGIVVDMPFGLSEACILPFLPDDEGKLPSEVPPAIVTPPTPLEPEIPPTDSISDSVKVIGELPYCDSFDDYIANYFVVVDGQWTFAEDESPNEPCGGDAGDSVGEDIDVSYSSEGVYSASQRNVSVWEGFDVTTLHRIFTTDLKILTGPAGAKHNGGIVVNYREHTSRPGTYVYYLIEVDYDNQEFSIKRWNGMSLQPAVVVSVPGIRIGHWYTVSVEILPHYGDVVYITAYLQGVTDPTISRVIGPLMTTNYRPEDGHFGLASNRSHTRFSYFKLEEL